MHNHSIRYMDIYSAAVIISVVLLFLIYVPEMPFSGLYDDLVGLVFAMFLFIGLLGKKRIPEQVKKVWKILLVISAIGIISNFYSMLDRTISDIISDLFSFWKIFLVYAGTATIIYNKPHRTYRILTVLGFLSRIFVIVAFIFGILNLFGFVNMSEGERYGIKMYSFFFGNASQFGVFIGASLALIMLSGKENVFYEIIGLAVLFMTTKGMSLVIFATYITFRAISGRKKIKKWQMFTLAMVLAFTVQFQAQQYLLNEDAPRALLLSYGVVTANEYIPFGAGFGTYGSNVAAEHYSPLYRHYGFEYINSLSLFNEDGKSAFLNDVYLGMLLGQFGYIGSVLFIYMIYLVAREIFKSNVTGKKKKFITIACFMCMCGMFVMAGSVKVQPGEMLMLVIAMYSYSGSGNISDVNNSDAC